MIARDASGNGLGGIRSPFVDVPDATYVTTTPGPGTCRELGTEKTFGWRRLEATYGTYANYSAKFDQAIDQMVKERFLTESDAKRLRLSVATH